MRIDRLEIKNFKKFSDFTIDLHPQFTLLVGDNGTGKTTILDALAVAAGIWLVNSPDTSLNNSRRNILPSEIHLETLETENIAQFIECKPVQIKAIGKINDQKVAWSRQIKDNGSKTSNTEAKEALGIISTLFQSVMEGNKIWMPIIAYYGAGRAGLASNQRNAKADTNLPSPARRWDAFYDCFEERIRITDLHTWFQKEVIASVNRQGQMRPGFNIVKYAILRCIPDFSNLWFDTEQSEIVVSIEGNPQPFRNLSAGQKMMVSLIADIAIKIVTQNASFISKEFNTDDNNLPLVLQRTTGLVLIDELDVHLHPKWQHQIVADLKSTFPAIQFVCTSHSPLVIGEVEAQGIRFIEYNRETGQDISFAPVKSYGLDANRVLDELMGAADRNKEIADGLHKLFQLIDEDDFDGARQAMIPIIEKVGESEPEITRARSLISFLEGS